MTESVRQHLPVIVVITLVGMATYYFMASWALEQTGAMTADSFDRFLFLAPCVVMALASFAIAMTAKQIGRQLYLVVTGICLALGIASMLVTASWQMNPDIAEALLANSPAGTVVVPVINSPIAVLRDIAAFFVAPTVGCIAGAWLGSRLHPMTSETSRKRKQSSASKKKRR